MHRDPVGKYTSPLCSPLLPTAGGGLGAMATIAGGANANMIGHAFEAAQLRKDAEAELCIRRLPPEQRRAQLLDPTDGPQRFLTLKRRLQMLREIGGPR